ncbi:MAG: GPP34 family phosphoprotein, partial [Acidobacteria bacterium]
QILSIAGLQNLVPITKTVAEAEALCTQQGAKPRTARLAPGLGLNLPESFCLLAFDAKAVRLAALPESNIVRVPAACAVMELALRERLDWDLNVVRVTDKRPTNDPVLDRVLEKVIEDSPQSIADCLRQIFNKASELEQEILRGLVAKCILSYRETKVAGLFRTQRLVVADPRPLAALRDDMRAVLMGNQIPDIREAVLVSLLNTCGLFAGILAEDEIDQCRSRISQLSQLDLIGQTLARLIHEIRKFAMLEPFM